MRQSPRLLLLAFLTTTLLGGNPASAESSSCQLNSGGEHNKIKHVIYIQFDNTHFKRDNPTVGSSTDAVTAQLHPQ
jgi:hypothetical protein